MKLLKQSKFTFNKSLYFLQQIYNRKKVIPLREGVTIIGSCPVIAGILVQRELVSKFQCFVYVRGEDIGIGDPCSKRGTFINNKKLRTTPKFLKPGDEIGLGISYEFLKGTITPNLHKNLFKVTKAKRNPARRVKQLK